MHPSLIALVHTWSSLHPPLPRKQEGRQKLPLVVLKVRQRELEGQDCLVSGEQAPVSVQMCIRKILAVRVLLTCKVLPLVGGVGMKVVT